MDARKSEDKSATLTWVDWESSKFIAGGPFWTPENQEPLKDMPRAGTGVQPREEVGGLKFAKKVAVRIGGKKSRLGDPLCAPVLVQDLVNVRTLQRIQQRNAQVQKRQRVPLEQ